MKGQNVSETMTPEGFGDPYRQLNHIENDLARLFCVALHYFDNMPTVAGVTTSIESREAAAIDQYQSDAIFHAKVDLLTQQAMKIIKQYI